MTNDNFKYTRRTSTIDFSLICPICKSREDDLLSLAFYLIQNKAICSTCVIKFQLKDVDLIISEVLHKEFDKRIKVEVEKITKYIDTNYTHNSHQMDNFGFTHKQIKAGEIMTDLIRALATANAFRSSFVEKLNTLNCKSNEILDEDLIGKKNEYEKCILKHENVAEIVRSLIFRLKPLSVNDVLELYYDNKKYIPYLA